MAARMRSILSFADQAGLLPDLGRFRLVLDSLPDAGILSALEGRRGHGRDDYPVQGMWRAFLARFVFQHGSGGKALASHSTGRKGKGKGRTSDPDAAWGSHAHGGVDRRTGKAWEGIKDAKTDGKLRPLNGDWTGNACFTEKGEVACRCPETGLVRPMAFQGHEAGRNANKHGCPAAQGRQRRSKRTKPPLETLKVRSQGRLVPSTSESRGAPTTVHSPK